MATVSGRIIFDRDRSVSVSGSDSGIANIPVVLQNINTSERLTVLTDSNGNFSFINVENGDYRIVESYGAAGGVPTPGDFLQAVPGSVPVGINPPVTAAVNPPPGSTNLDSLTPDTLFITVTGDNLSNLNFFNGPVIYTPIETILDTCAVISGDNLIEAADNGTFGTFPPGTLPNTGVPEEPYPGVTPDFIYVLPNPNTYTPFGGEYTVQNIMNDALSEVIGAWWRIADHSEGNETGRMMVVNGANPGAVFFRATVAVKPNTNYLFTSWILNLFKVTGYPNPELGVRITGCNGELLYNDTLGKLIPPNLNAPEWKQIGSVINSRDNTCLTVEFLSEGPEVIGNDYAIDDISFNEIEIPIFTPVKTVNRQSVFVGETVEFTVTLTNTCQSSLTNLFFQDIIPKGLSFVAGSVTINGVLNPEANPNIGFILPDITGSSTVTVSFEAKADTVPVPNPVLNQASISYDYTPVEGGIPGRYFVTSNEVPVEVSAEADISVFKTASPGTVEPGGILTYTINVSNRGPSPAENVILLDSIPAAISGAEVSIDGGATFFMWTGSYNLGLLQNGEMRTIIIRGTVNLSATGSISNTAVVESTTPDPDLTNNSSTAVTSVTEQADISVFKLGYPNPVLQGEILTYTLTVSNAGPAAAVNTVLTDSVPDSLTNVEYSTDNGASFQPWSGTLALGTLEPGFALTILIRGVVKPSAAGIIRNTATVDSSTPDPNLSNNSSTYDTAVTQSADLSVTKVGSPSPVAAGGQLTYTVTITNMGPGDAQGVTLTDNIPPQVENPEYSLDGGITFQPWSGSALLGTLAYNTSRTVLIRGVVNATATGIITNTVFVSSPTPDPNPENNQYTEITPVNTSADLSVTKTGSPNPAIPGQYLIYTVTVRNSGPNPAVNTILTDMIPSDLSDVQFSVDNGASWVVWTGTYSLGTLNPDITETMLIRGIVSLSASGIITNTAVVTSETPDPNPNNNQDTAFIPVNESADLSVAKTVSPSTVTAGGQITYTITISNAGPSLAQNVVLSDTVPAEIINPEFAVQGGTNFVPWSSPYSVGNLAAGQIFIVTIRGMVNPSIQNGAISNTAVVSSSTPDPEPDNNTDTVETPVTVSADVSVFKRADLSTAVPGESFSYTITVSNAGPSDAQNVNLIDAVPFILQNPLVSLDNGATYFTWSSPLVLGTIAAQTSRTIFLRGTLSRTAAGEIVNTAVVDSTTPDPNMDNNLSTDTTPISQSADLSIVKTASPNPVFAGGQILYTLIVTNGGPSTADNVVLTDILPMGLNDAEISADNGNVWLPFNGEYQIGNMAAGIYIRLLIRASVSANAEGILSNTAVVSSTTSDPNQDNNSDTVKTPVFPSADISITKSSSPNPVEIGSILTYRLTVSNAGPSNAVNVAVQDRISSELTNVEFSTDEGSSWQTWPNSYLIGSLAAGTAFTLLIRGTVVKGSGTAITNFAVVTSDTPDPDLSNNTDESITDIIDSISADISVTKSADPSTAVIGDFITYKITVTNYGPNTAENTVLYDELSESLSDAEFSVDGGAAWNRWANSYSIGELAPGGNVTVLIRAVVLSDECGRICNTASVTSSTPDINLDNNSYCLSTPVQRGADLSITKTACLSRTDCSLCINYTLVVCNCGPEKARHIVITDKLPAEVCNPVYSVDNGNTWCPWSGRFTVLELEVDECICILIQGRINPCATGSIDNTAKVVSATPDPNLCNNRDSVRVKLK